MKAPHSRSVFKAEGKNSRLPFVYNFRFCVLRPQAGEEYLSSPAGFLWFGYFYYMKLS
jgi:hypothetical protein